MSGFISTSIAPAVASRLLTPNASIAVIFDGDSKGYEPQQAMQWAQARANVEVDLSPAMIYIGGTKTGSAGGSDLITSTRMANIASAIQAQQALGNIVDYSLEIGTNDVTVGTAPATVMGNIRKLHEQVLRPNKVRYLILWGVTPRTGGFQTTIADYNNLYRNYAIANPQDVIYVDATPWWTDFASSTGDPVGGATSVAGAITNGDGLHGSNNGTYMSSFAIEPVMRKIYPPRNPSRVIQRGIAADTYSNQVGVNGRLLAIGGTNSMTNTGTGSITGTPPLGWTATGALTGTLSVTFSAITSVPSLETEIGRTSIGGVRIAFSGSPSSSGSLRLQSPGLFPAVAWVAGDIIGASLLVNMNALAGLSQLSLNTNQHANLANLGNGSTNIYDALPAISGIHDFRRQITLSSGYGGYFHNLDIFWTTSQPLTGSIDLVSTSSAKVGPVPAATP